MRDPQEQHLEPARASVWLHDDASSRTGRGRRPDACLLDLQLAAGLVDLAAAMLGKAYQRTRLNRAHAELKATHEMLARTEKLRALGEMAAGISHDIKNILGPLYFQVDLLERAPDDADRVLKAAERLKRFLKRGNRYR